jgi:hypothetical protein
MAWLAEGLQAFWTEEGSAVLQRYSNALVALGQVSIALGTAAAMPPDSFEPPLKHFHDQMTEGRRSSSASGSHLRTQPGVRLARRHGCPPD